MTTVEDIRVAGIFISFNVVDVKEFVDCNDRVELTRFEVVALLNGTVDGNEVVTVVFTLYS